MGSWLYVALHATADSPPSSTRPLSGALPTHIPKLEVCPPPLRTPLRDSPIA